MRGKLPVAAEVMAVIRIIPAHAGQTRSRSPHSSPYPDHPRACGANLIAAVALILAFGSSPRMRGKLLHHRVRAVDHRIIPAHAGQTYAADRAGIRWADHPRACGANALRKLNRNTSTGSSPRMRGKRRFSICDIIGHRIIPAHAGQTRFAGLYPYSRTDHPRACGANAFVAMRRTLMNGSSPRMRGKRSGRCRFPLLLRIIPAHAGQTVPSWVAVMGGADHPRACGANCGLNRPVSVATGSSPRMRGKLHGVAVLLHNQRIIPAHAGQTRSHHTISGRHTDHPRACGAN